MTSILWIPGPWVGAYGRRLAAVLLRRASWALGRLSRKLAPPAALPRSVVVTPLPTVEFYADEGAPEGALFVDGVYIGQLDVHRL